MNEFELEQEQTRAEVAAYLRKLADGLDQDNKLTFIVGDESTTINPPEQLHLETETDAGSSWLGGDDGRSFIIELGWEADEVGSDDELTTVNRPNHPRSVRGEDHA